MPKKQAERPAVARAIAATQVFQQRLMSLHAADFTSLDITMAQAKLLYVLVVSGELTMSETARQLGVTISTASGAVDALVGLGLVDRSEDPSNRRQVRVSVTERGASTLEQMQDLSSRHFRMLFDLVTDEDLAVVERATNILADAASAAQRSQK
jgi:DNA-binding MarR family transcriptional regulator